MVVVSDLFSFGNHVVHVAHHGDLPGSDVAVIFGREWTSVLGLLFGLDIGQVIRCVLVLFFKSGNAQNTLKCF